MRFWKKRHVGSNEALHLGVQGTLLCHHFGQRRLRAYPDPHSELGRAMRENKPIGPHLDGHPWAIGWGDSGDDVFEGLEITAQEADLRFARRVAERYEPAVRHAVKVPLQQYQFDALVSIFLTCGCKTMSHSILVRQVNRRDNAGAAAQFSRYVKARGQVQRELQRRREAERLMFLGLDAAPAIAMALRAFP